MRVLTYRFNHSETGRWYSPLKERPYIGYIFICDEAMDLMTGSFLPPRGLKEIHIAASTRRFDDAVKIRVEVIPNYFILRVGTTRRKITSSPGSLLALQQLFPKRVNLDGKTKGQFTFYLTAKWETPKPDEPAKHDQSL